MIDKIELTISRWTPNICHRYYLHGNDGYWLEKYVLFLCLLLCSLTEICLLCKRKFRQVSVLCMKGQRRKTERYLASAYSNLCCFRESIILYYAIKNTANQNAGKPPYIQRYYIQPSHDALRFYSRRNLVMVWPLYFLWHGIK